MTGDRPHIFWEGPVLEGFWQRKWPNDGIPVDPVMFPLRAPSQNASVGEDSYFAYFALSAKQNGFTDRNQTL